MKKRIGVKLADISPLEYYDGLRIPTFVIASDNDEMIQLEEMEQLFRSIKSKVKKFRVARGTHSEERPYSLMNQCFDFADLILKTHGKHEQGRPNLDANNSLKDNFISERWANNVSEIQEEPQFNPITDEYDPWIKEKSTIMYKETYQNVIQSQKPEQNSNRIQVASNIRPPRKPEVHKVHVTTQEIKSPVPGEGSTGQHSSRSNANSRQHYSSMLDVQPLQIKSRSHSRSRTPGNVRIKKTTVEMNRELSSIQPSRREVAQDNFMDVESDDEFKPLD